VSESLGEKYVPEERYSADFELLDRFTGFSGELVRIAILGMAALGFFLKELMPKDPNAFRSATWLALLLSWAAVLLGLAVAFGLLHRYYATDGVAFHVAWLRYVTESRPDTDIAEQAAGRKRSYKLSEGWLTASACSVAAGVIVLGLAFIIRFSIAKDSRATAALIVAVVVTAAAAAMAIRSWRRILGDRSGLTHTAHAGV